MEKKIKVLAAFETLGPERIQRAVDRAYPFKGFYARGGNPCDCFAGHAGDAMSTQIGWMQMSHSFRSETVLLHRMYEMGHHEQLRQWAVEWLAGVASPPKERAWVKQLVAVGLVLLLVVLV